MKQGWRWFGTHDSITLKEIKQAGVTDIVTALHEVRCGELWTVEAIQARQAEVKAAGMTWTVVESLPVHESIKMRRGDFKAYMETYKASMRNLAACGIRVICYNFMPILDWTRSQLDYQLPDGSTVLNCDEIELAAFDCFMLKRTNAEATYTPEIIAQAKAFFDQATDEQKKKLADGILLGLPGTVDDLTIEQFRDLLSTYDGIDDQALRSNLYAFLNELAPLCDELDMVMAIHPDDPPRPIFGLPRILSTKADIMQMCQEVPNDRMGVTFCSGSLGGNLANNEVEIFKACARRIHFVHFRNVEYTEGKTFHESASHLCGKVNMPGLMKVLLEEERRRGSEIVMRPDHGRYLEIDHGRTCYNGYSYGGRAIGLAELRGLELGLQRGQALGDKVVVITGASGVLCSVIAEDLLRQGAKVAILDRSEEAAMAFQARLNTLGLTQTIVLVSDVLDRAQLQAARDTVLKTWGRIDVLINGAGGNHPKGTTPAEQFTADTPLADSFFGLEMEGFEFVNRLNIIGTILPSQVFGEAMIAQGGSIVNISSMAASQPLTKVAAYGAAKAGVDNFTRWLATHLAPMNVRVNAIAPGFFITNQNRFLMLEPDGETLTPRGNKVIAKTPMRKFGKPEDLCGAVRFLISDDASFITGVDIPVDGGFLAYSGV